MMKDERITVVRVSLDGKTERWEFCLDPDGVIVHTSYTATQGLHRVKIKLTDGHWDCGQESMDAFDLSYGSAAPLPDHVINEALETARKCLRVGNPLRPD